jgi:hypothetical protein
MGYIQGVGRSVATERLIPTLESVSESTGIPSSS